MKQCHKIWLEPEDYKRLQLKASSAGFTGKGSLSHYIERIARNEVILVDGGLKSFVNLIDKIRTTRA